MTDQETSTQAHSPPPGPTPSSSSLPFRKIVPFIAGVAAGIVMRLIFWGDPEAPYSAMLGSFIYFAPMLVGAVTVYVAERIERRTWAYYLSASFIANVLFVLGTLLIMIEGLICAIVIAPLFGVMGMVGGLIMGACCRVLLDPRRPLYGFAMLPVLLGAMEPPASSARFGTVERSTLIAAPAERVWQVIQNSDAIRPDEVDSAWLYRIGVPLPLSGVTHDEAGRKVRTITMGKSVRFDQVVTQWQENRLMQVEYRYQPDSFPPHALDQHVVLGGAYFDVESTAYVLDERDGHTKLTVRLEYRVQTPFNWYADSFARVLFSNFENVILDFYRRRSEAKA